MVEAGHLRTKDSGIVRFIWYSDHFGATSHQVLGTLGRRSGLSFVFALMAFEALSSPSPLLFFFF